MNSKVLYINTKVYQFEEEIFLSTDIIVYFLFPNLLESLFHKPYFINI